MSTIRSAKQVLRKKIATVIGQLNAEEKQRQSRKVFEKVCTKMYYYEKLNGDRARGYVAHCFQEIFSEINVFMHSQLRALPQFKKSKRISIYLSTENELDTIQILKHLFETNKEVFVPRYIGKQMDMVKLFSMEDYEKLSLTKWNIKQPNIRESRENALDSGGLDLIILPGVAFTADGKRLGHGMGYYDKYLMTCLKKQKRKPHLIGVAFNEQMLENIPTTENDVLLDSVLAEICN